MERKHFSPTIKETLTNLLNKPGEPIVYNTQFDVMSADLRPGLEYAPSWLSLSALRVEISKLNHPELMSSLIEAGHPLMKSQGFEPEDAKLISQENTKFFGVANQMLVTAAVFGGPDFIKHVTEEGKVRSKSFSAACKLMMHYNCPAEDFDALYRRLMHLFPVQGEETDYSAISLLRQTGAFHQTSYGGFDFQERSERKCPATSLTQEIYEAYGDILSDQNYRDRLQKKLTYISPSEYVLKTVGREIAETRKKQTQTYLVMQTKFWEVNSQIV